ncbi:TylF/MycF/NovP-related O-methyltransferase [Fulvivirgaceae bacterium LMO-SS25]
MKLKKIKDVFIRVKKLVRLGLTSKNRFLDDALFQVELDKLIDKEEKYNQYFDYLSHKSFTYGFAMYNKNLKWIDDKTFLDLIKGSPDPNQRYDRKFVAWQLAKYTSNLEGDTVECGVLRGATSYLICKTIDKRMKINHHIFDSFEGLSKPLNEDLPGSDRAFKWNEGDLSVPLEKVKDNLREFDFIKYYKGWIPSKFHEVEDLKFKFVHVDVDLYQPTKDSLDFFYSKLVPGGILLCDDYGFYTCEGANKAFNELVKEHNIPNVIHLPTGQGYIIKL